MATDFYKQDGSYYTAPDKKVADVAALQSLATAGGKEIAAPKPVIDTTTVPTTALIDTPEQTAAITAAKASSVKEQGLDAAYQRTLSGTANATDKANLDYAIKAGVYKTPEQKALDAATLTKTQNEAAAIAAGAGVTEKPKPTNIVTSSLDELIKKKTESIGAGVDVGKYQEASTTASLEVEKSRQAIADKGIIDAVTVKQFEDRVIPLEFIRAQQDKFTDDQYIPNLLAAQDYNNKLILSKMASGDLLTAQQMNKDIADDLFEIQKLQIDKAVEENRIDENDKARLDKQAEDDRDLALNGFIKITGPSGLKNLTEDQLMRVPNPITGVVDIYKKPVELEQIETQVVTAGGKSLLINKQTGETIKDLGGAYKASTGGGGAVNDKDNAETVAFKKDLSTALGNLSADPSTWGQQWNYMFSRYRGDLEAGASEQGISAQAFLDQLLNKEMFNPEKKEEGGGGIFSGIQSWYNSLNQEDAADSSTPPMIK